MGAGHSQNATKAKPVKPDFTTPHESTSLLANACALMPAYSAIPDEFKRGGTPFNEVQAEWFFRGLGDWPLWPKPGIDQEAAIRHLSAIQGSWEPKHEHKTAGVAYLMSLWFESPATGKD